jgi:hypothetical protein
VPKVIVPIKRAAAAENSAAPAGGQISPMVNKIEILMIIKALLIN